MVKRRFVSPPSIRRVRRRIGGRISRRAAYRGALGSFARVARRVSPYATGAYLGYRGARWAARKAKFSFKRIGNPVGLGTTKRDESHNTAVLSRDTRSLYLYDLVRLSQGSDINDRERQLVNIRGCKMCMQFTNTSNDNLYLNVALIAFKGGSQEASISTTDFFRAEGGLARSVNFDTTLDACEFHTLPINTDKYAVFQHKRYQLIPGSAVGGNKVALTGRNYMTLDWYRKINRQFRFDNATGNQPEDGQVWLVHWADKMDSESGQVVEVGQYTAKVRVISYFKDPKN